MAKGKKRIIVFIGATAIEVTLAWLFGINFMDSLGIVLLGNFLAAMFADYIYKRGGR